jgi:alkylmercury lyase
MSTSSADRQRHIDWWDTQQDEQRWFALIPHIYRLVARGRPVELEELAAAASTPVSEVEAALRHQPGTDWDERGRLVGFGLTLRPTPHHVTVDGRTLYTFCASDALTVPVILGRPVTIESPSPITG